MTTKPTTAQLAEAEAIALRDYAAFYIRERAFARPLLGDRERVREEMSAAAYVLGALSAGIEAGREVDVVFFAQETAWLRRLRDEFRNTLADQQRGSSEVNENTPADTFLLFVLDGICGEAG